MSEKQLADVCMFLTGDPALLRPARVYLQYHVVSGAASGKPKTYQIPDPNTVMGLGEFWSGAIAEIKKIENIN